MLAVYIACGVLFALIIAFLLVPLRINMVVRVRARYTEIIFGLRLLMTLQLAFRFRARYCWGEGLFFARVMPDNSEHILYTPGKRKRKKSRHYFTSVVSACDLKEISVFARIGLSDAAATVYLAQTLRTAFLSLRDISRARGEIQVIPDCAQSYCSLNLECIFVCFPLKLIKEIINRNKKKGSKQNAAD